MPTVFTGGRFLLPEGVRTGLALVVRDGRIDAIVPEAEAPEGLRVDAGGQFISPGFIDMHVHGGRASISKGRSSLRPKRGRRTQRC